MNNGQFLGALLLCVKVDQKKTNRGRFPILYSLTMGKRRGHGAVIER